MSEQRVAKRIRRRMACEIQADGRQQRAIVLDLSRTGLFVQTSARLSPGSVLDLSIPSEGREPIVLRAAVARQKAVPSNLTSVAQGGVGLRILDAPRAYYELIGERPPLPGRAAGPPAPGAPAAPAPPAAERPRFRVRVKQREGPRSRILDVFAETAERACAAALEQVGAGWEALGAERA